MKKALKIIGGSFVVLLAILIIAMIIDISNDDKTVKDTANEKETTQSVKQTVKWEDKVKEVAQSSGTTTEKFDAISKFARDYEPTSAELSDFEAYIIKEYKDKKYIMNLSDHEYMLGNIFKSQVVEKNETEEAMKNFAFDFWQNSKYNYRGVENMTSESTLANERQMDKALSQMGK